MPYFQEKPLSFRLYRIVPQLTEYGEGKIVGTIIPDNTTNEDELVKLRTKLIKQLGAENARTLWNQWATAPENYFDFLVARQLDDGKGPSMHSLIATTDQILAFLAVRVLKRLNEKHLNKQTNIRNFKIRVIIDDESSEGQHRNKSTRRANG